MKDALVNPYPRILGKYRIGTPINADINRADPLSPAFEMPALLRRNCLVPDVNPNIEQTIRASGCDTQAQDAWGFSSDSALKLSCFVDSTLSAHVERATNWATSNSQRAITAIAKQETTIALRKNLSSDQLLDCATPDFRTRIAAIRSAWALPPETRSGALRHAYADFYRTYGTGCVSSLVLGAIGVAKCTAAFTSTRDEKTATYGGSFSVSGFNVSGATAFDYASRTMESRADGTLDIQSLGMPAGSPPAAWASALAAQFADRQLAQIDKGQAWAPAFDRPCAKAQPPEIRSRPVPNHERLPQFVGGDIENQVRDLKLAEYVDAWKRSHNEQSPPANQYERWVDDLKQAAARVTAEDCAKAVVMPVFSGAASPRPPQPGGPSIPALKPGTQFMALAASADLEASADSRGSTAAADADNGDDLVFNGYGVVGFDYTPWEQYFPELAPVRSTITDAQVGLGVALAWLAIRGQFAQYLQFCATYFDDVVPDGTSAAANAFQQSVDEIARTIVDAVGRSDPSGLYLEQIEERFRAALRAHRFTLTDHYQLLIDSYPWLARVPFGAVPTVEFRGQIHYQPYKTTLNQSGTAPAYQPTVIGHLEWPAATLLERGALRLYPIIATDGAGKPYFFWTNAETVTLNGHEYWMGASMLNCWTHPTSVMGLERNYDWGMCRPLGAAATPGRLAALTGETRSGLRHVPHVEIEPTDYDKSSWRVHRDTEYDAQGPAAYYVLTRSAVGIAGPDLRPEHFRLVLLGLGQQLDRHAHPLEVQLVPVDYREARNARNTPEGLIGGGPMWFEPRTDEIINALHQLGH